MINILAEFEKLMEETPLPYDRKPISLGYQDEYSQRVVIVCKPSTVISIGVWQEGIQLDGYVYENKQWMRYDLGRVLFNRVPKENRAIEGQLNPNITQDEKNHLGVKNIYCKLLQYGDDILKGELEWTKEYPTKPTRTHDYSYLFFPVGDVDYTSVHQNSSTSYTEYTAIVTPYGYFVDEDTAKDI